MADGTNTGRLAGRVAVITGAANGIGAAFAERLAQEGADVAICDIAPGERTAATVAETGRRSLALECDITSGPAVAEFAARTAAELGRCDILVHNAALYPEQSFLEMTYADWRRVLDVNLDSFYHLGQAFIPGMVEAGWGRVVAVTSGTFQLGWPRYTHYNASKGGLIGVLRSLASELSATGVTFNGISPGLTRTETTETTTPEQVFQTLAEARALKRDQLPADLVGALAFLCSDDAAFITGQNLAVDGGTIYQ